MLEVSMEHLRKKCKGEIRRVIATTTDNVIFSQKQMKYREKVTHISSVSVEHLWLSCYLVSCCCNACTQTFPPNPIPDTLPLLSHIPHFVIFDSLALTGINTPTSSFHHFKWSGRNNCGDVLLHNPSKCNRCAIRWKNIEPLEMPHNWGISIHRLRYHPQFIHCQEL